MSIDRSKFKKLGTKAADMAQADEDLNKAMGRKGRTDILTIEEGRNVFRLYPPHSEEDGGGTQFSEAKVTVFLPIMVPERDDNNQIVKKDGVVQMKEQYKPIFNSRIHGGTEKDLVDEYNRIAIAEAEKRFPNAKSDETQKKAKEKFLANIYGQYNSKDPKNSIKGTKYDQSHVMYADKIKGTSTQFGSLEVKKTVKDRLNALAAIEAADDPLGTDPFTDIDEGRTITILYDKSAGTKAYTTELNSEYENQKDASGRNIKVLVGHPLTDEQLEHWSKQEPLKKRFVNVFRKKDFQYQLEGLERHDKKANLGIFDLPEFQAVAEEIALYFANEVEEEQGGEEGGADNEQTSGSNDHYDLLTRDELKSEIKERKLGIVVRPNISDDQLRAFLREDDEANEAANEPEGEHEPEQTEEAPKAEKPQQSSTSKSRLDKLRDSTKKK